MLATVDDLKPVALQQFRDSRGALVAIELSRSVPFKVVRLFWVYDVPLGGCRGSHAHKACNQYYICAAGSLQVEAYDGNAERTIAMTAGQALHVPPAIFTTERFDSSGSVLMVFCDCPYDPEDYVNDRNGLVAYRSTVSKL
jgi:oxalate decarboxylase/phosphoglucose isomerase-like protein (cupin superfamily)